MTICEDCGHKVVETDGKWKHMSCKDGAPPFRKDGPRLQPCDCPEAIPYRADIGAVASGFLATNDMGIPEDEFMTAGRKLDKKLGRSNK